MFGMSFAEIMIVCILVLVFLGPEKIPEVARMVGKTLRELRKTGNMLRDALMLEDDHRRNKNLPRTTYTPPASDAGPIDQMLDDDSYHDDLYEYDPHHDTLWEHEHGWVWQADMPSQRLPIEGREVVLASRLPEPIEPDDEPSLPWTNGKAYANPHTEAREVHLHQQTTSALTR